MVMKFRDDMGGENKRKRITREGFHALRDQNPESLDEVSFRERG
jgi:hypothetical protein